jgi:hypothetical protein
MVSFGRVKFGSGKMDGPPGPAAGLKECCDPALVMQGKQSAAEAVLISAIPMSRGTTKRYIRDMTSLFPVRYLKIPTRLFSERG